MTEPGGSFIIDPPTATSLGWFLLILCCVIASAGIVWLGVMVLQGIQREIDIFFGVGGPGQGERRSKEQPADDAILDHAESDA